MIANVRIDITDSRRRLLASKIAGKAVQRLATRKEIVSFVEGCIAAACEDRSDTEDDPAGKAVPASSHLTPAERQTVERLRSEGKGDSYITGWLIGGRPSSAKRPRL